MFYRLDITIFRFVNDACKTVFLDRVGSCFTFLGSNEFVFIAAIVFLIRRKKEDYATGILLLAGSTLSYFITSLIKDMVRRPRPFLTLPNVNIINTVDGFSFPSGHTIMAFMFAYILAERFGKKYMFFTLAAFVGLSRIYLGVHYPSDVLAGVFIGYFSGYFLTRIAKRAGLD